MEPLKRLSRELKYKGAIIDIYVDKVQGPDGKVHDYDFIGHNGAAAVLPVKDDGKILPVVMFNEPKGTGITVENTASFKSMTSGLFGSIIILVGGFMIFRNYKKKENFN